jgi:hypothetical protein
MEVVLIVLGALVLALIVWMLVKKQRERRLEGQREEAGELRQTARSHELHAQEHRAEAERHAREAAEVDPDIEHSDTQTR